MCTRRTGALLPDSIHVSAPENRNANMAATDLAKLSHITGEGAEAVLSRTVN